MDMVEKVARALAHSAGAKITGPSRHRATDEFGWDAGHQYMQKYVEAHWRDSEPDARAAIEAMQEPDEAFLERLAERAHDGRFSKSGELYPVYRNFLRAFFDAALGDQP